MDKNKTKIFTAKLDKSEHREFKKIADRNDRSMSAQLRAWIKEDRQ